MYVHCVRMEILGFHGDFLALQDDDAILQESL
jgi:hypothetical protein